MLNVPRNKTKTIQINFSNKATSLSVNKHSFFFFPLKRVVEDTDRGSNVFSDQMLTANFPFPTLLCQVVPSFEQSSRLFTCDFMALYFALS